MLLASLKCSQPLAQCFKLLQSPETMPKNMQPKYQHILPMLQCLHFLPPPPFLQPLLCFPVHAQFKKKLHASTFKTLPGGTGRPQMLPDAIAGPWTKKPNPKPLLCSIQVAVKLRDFWFRLQGQRIRISLLSFMAKCKVHSKEGNYLSSFNQAGSR